MLKYKLFTAASLFFKARERKAITKHLTVRAGDMNCEVSILVLASSFLTISSACSMIDYKYKKIEGCEQSSLNRT